MITILEEKVQRQLGYHFLTIHLSLNWTWVVIIIFNVIFIFIYVIPFANNIGPEGAKAIGISLSNNSSLTSLDPRCDYNIWYDVFNYNHISFNLITILDQKVKKQLQMQWNLTSQSLSYFYLKKNITTVLYPFNLNEALNALF